MCGDCERPMEEVMQNKPGCVCQSCTTGGSVIAVESSPRSTHRGLAPWCVACHHFILTSPAPKL